jgi:sugar phosphate isomerase/epimerase
MTQRGPGSTLFTVGVQLYTVRDFLGEHTNATLARLAEIGFEELELFHEDVAELATLARAHGLRTVSTHVPMTSLTNGRRVRRDEARAMFEAMRPHGIEFVGTYLPFNACRRNAEFWNETADTLSEVGNLAKKAGLRFFYHNHAVELTALPGGILPLDLLIQQTEPDTVSLELDVFWASATGADPVVLLERLGSRVALLHLKDQAPGAPTVVDDTTMPRDAFAAIGEGTLPIDALMRASRALEIRHVFVEQDHAADPLASLSRSMENIHRMGQDIQTTS